MGTFPQRGESNTGGYSSRGVGIPVGGAIGGGDGAAQKIGRPRRVPGIGDGGSPTCAADSTFASYSARVNKSYEPGEDDGPMFPEQDPDFLASIAVDADDVLPRTSKIPNTGKVATRRGVWRLYKDFDRMRETDLRYRRMTSLLAECDYQMFSEKVDELLEDASSDLVTTAVGEIPWIGDLLVAAKALGPDLINLGLATTSFFSDLQRAGVTSSNSVLTSPDSEFDAFLDKLRDADPDLKKRLQKELMGILSAMKSFLVSLLSALPDEIVSGGISAIISKTPVSFLAAVVKKMGDVTRSIRQAKVGGLPIGEKLLSAFGIAAASASLNPLVWILGLASGMDPVKCVERLGMMISVLEKTDSQMTETELRELVIDVLREEDKKKRKKIAQDEMSTTASISGYTAPLGDFGSSKRKKDFMSTVRRSYGGGDFLES